MDESEQAKHEKRAWDFAKADQSQWERLLENPKLINEIHQIQFHYGFPMKFEVFYKWLGWDEPIEIDEEKGEIRFGPRGERREKLRTDIEKLAESFNIPAKWHDSLYSFVTRGSKKSRHLSLGFPSMRMRKEDNQIKYELILTPETDIGNPIVMRFIETWQARNRTTPPYPRPMKDNSRKLDWRPVWEWKKYHPDVTHKEIAEILGYSHQRVRLKLAELGEYK